MEGIEFIVEFGHERGGGGLPYLPLHRNPGLEIVYVRHGHLVWECEGRTEVVPPESIFFTLPWQEHGSVLDFEPGHEWFFVVIRLERACARTGNFQLPTCFNLDAPTTRSIVLQLSGGNRHTWASSNLISMLLPTLINEMERPSSFHVERVRQLCAQLVLELAGVIDAQKAHPSEPDAGPQRIGALIKELDRDFARDWRCTEMAERVGLRRTQFAKLFEHCTGDTPKRFLHRLRIVKSRQMLRETPGSITQIALDCGFSSSQHFANVFRRFTGVSARAFRASKPSTSNISPETTSRATL